MAENKIEAILSFKLDPTGLKDAEKELETLEKQLKDLNEQQAGAGPGKGSPETARQIADTEKAIKLNKLQQGDPEAAKEFQGALEGKLGGRNPSKTFTDNFEKAVSGALKDLFGDVVTPQAKQRIVDAMVEAIPTRERPAGTPKAPSEEESAAKRARRAENPLQVQLNPPEEYKPSVTPEALQTAPVREAEGAGQARKTAEEGVTGANPAANAVVAEVDAQVQERNAQEQAVGELPRIQSEREEARQGRRSPRGANRAAARYHYGRQEADIASQIETIDKFEPKPEFEDVARNRPGTFRRTLSSRVGARYRQDRDLPPEERSGALALARYRQQQAATFDPFAATADQAHVVTPAELDLDPFTGRNINTKPPTLDEIKQGVADRQEREAQARAQAQAAAFRATAGPESFIANPLDPKAKLSPTDKASRDLANNQVKGVLSDQAEIDKNNAKINKAQADSLAKEVKGRKELAEKTQVANKLLAEVTPAERDLRVAMGIKKAPTLTPDEARSQTGKLQDAYSAQQGILKEAQKAGDTDAVSDAANKLSGLSKAAQELNQSFTGTAKSTDSFQKSIKTVTHAADLREERATLKASIAEEPDKDLRRVYAHALNLNSQKLVPLTADPEERRALNTENVQRNKEYGLQSDMMASFGQFLAGNVLMSAGRTARAPYTLANQSFDQFNQQHQIDPVLLSSQRANQAATLGLGEQFQNYDLFKNSLAHAAITNPLAPAGAVVGDIAGAVAGPAGSLMQTGASLKMAASDSKLVNGLMSGGMTAGTLGLAGLAGGALGLGLGALLTNLGPDKKDPFQTLRSYYDSKGIAGEETQKNFGSQIQALKGPQLKVVQSDVQKAADLYDRYEKANAITSNLLEPDRGKVATAEKEKVVTLDDLTKLADKIAKETRGVGFTDEQKEQLKKNPELLKGFIQTFQESLLQGGSEAVKKFQQIINNDPIFKLQQKQMNQQRADQQQDEQRSRQQLDRTYSRQQEDFTRTRTRTREDYNVNEQRLGVSRTRAAQDFALANEQNDRGYFRTTRDVGTSLQREQEDQTRQRARQSEDYNRSIGRLADNRDISTYRLQRDTSRGLERTTEDVSRGTGRTLEDAGRTVQRAQEDAARTWQRSVEDTSRTWQRSVEDTDRTWQRTNEDASRTLSRAFEDASITLARAGQDFSKNASRAIDDATLSRSRLSQDYNREVNQQNKSYLRQSQDTDQSYQDSVLGIVAPGLASNPAYQLMKLNRDYVKNKGRAAEDYQQGRTDLNTSTDRSFDDISKSLKRGLDDMTQSFQRTMDDVGKSLARTSEDVNTTLARTAEDIATTLSRTGQDIATTLSRTGEDIATSLSRTLTDTATSVARAMEDSATTMQRATQDTATALSDGMVDINKNFSQGVEDLNTSLTRAIQDLDTSDFRARFDAMRTLDDAKIDYDTNRNKLALDYNRQVEDLNNAEYDLRKDYNRSIEDLNTAQQRATQDYKTASDGLNIQIARATRDFEDASSSFVMSVASAAGLISTYNTEIANAAVNPATSGGSTEGGNGSVPASPDPNSSVPGLGGLNEIPKDEFPAMLHEGEMVVTREESQLLRTSGYRPESKNLREALPGLIKRVLPGFADGYNGGTNQTPAAATPYWMLGHPEWEPGKGAKWLEAQAAGSNVIKPLDTPVAPSHDPYARDSQGHPFGMVMPDGYGGDSAHPNRISADQGRQMADAMWDRIHHPDPNRPQFVPGRMGDVHFDQYGRMYQDPTVAAHTNYPQGTTAADWQTDPSRWYNPDRSQPTYLMGNSGGVGSGQVTSSRPDWYQPNETMGFSSQAAFYAANPQWAPGTGSEWLKNIQAQNTPTYLPGPDYPDPGVRYTNSQGQTSSYASMADFQHAHGGPGQNPTASSIASGIGTQQALTNGSTRGIISATSAITPPAASSSGSSSSSRFGDVTVNVNISGGGSSRLQQILNQSTQAFARSLATKDLSLV
jgi:hypothetical protein